MRSLDEQLLRAARTHGHSPRADRAVAGFSRAGEHAGIWLALGVLGARFDRPRRARWRRATAEVALVYVINTAIKRLIGRRRPALEGLPALTSTATALSFPSAHASSSFAGALIYRRLGLPALPLYTLAGGLSISRLYLGVHYPSDILAGAALGTVLGALFTRAERDPGGQARA